MKEQTVLPDEFLKAMAPAFAIMKTMASDEHVKAISNDFSASRRPSHESRKRAKAKKKRKDARRARRRQR